MFFRLFIVLFLCLFSSPLFAKEDAKKHFSVEDNKTDEMPLQIERRIKTLNPENYKTCRAKGKVISLGENEKSHYYAVSPKDISCIGNSATNLWVLTQNGDVLFTGQGLSINVLESQHNGLFDLGISGGTAGSAFSETWEYDGKQYIKTEQTKFNATKKLEPKKLDYNFEGHIEISYENIVFEYMNLPQFSDFPAELSTVNNIKLDKKWIEKNLPEYYHTRSQNDEFTINYNGKFILITKGGACTGCQQNWVVDAETQKIIADFWTNSGTLFYKNSNLIIANAPPFISVDYGNYGSQIIPITFYIIKNDSLVELMKVDIFNNKYNLFDLDEK